MAYALTEDGADELARMVEAGSAPVSAPGFVSRRADAGRLAELAVIAGECFRMRAVTHREGHEQWQV